MEDKLISGRFLSIGNACNLRCKFCYNDDERNGAQFFNKLNDIYKAVISIRKKRNHIAVVGGEPFLHPNILEILGFIKCANFREFWIVSNGLKVADLSFALLLYKYNVNSLEISIHSVTTDMEYNITNRDGKNFYLREKGVENIVLLNKKFSNQIKLYSNSVINIHNYLYIIDLIKYIYSLGIKNLTVSFIYDLKGHSYENREQMVKYTDVIDIINKSDYILPEDMILKIDWLPYCLHKKIKFNNYLIREVEDYNKKNFSGDLKVLNKKKLDVCNRCSVYGKYCNGVFIEYLKKYGEEEFYSIT